ncbi:hypothetical protein EBZ80_10600 [bacterium]|nr:hypothetical protein [bacterium]
MNNLQQKPTFKSVREADAELVTLLTDALALLPGSRTKAFALYIRSRLPPNARGRRQTNLEMLQMRVLEKLHKWHREGKVSKEGLLWYPVGPQG